MVKQYQRHMSNNNRQQQRRQRMALAWTWAGVVSYVVSPLVSVGARRHGASHLFSFAAARAVSTT
jgi:hypothetical protein